MILLIIIFHKLSIHEMCDQLINHNNSHLKIMNIKKSNN